MGTRTRLLRAAAGGLLLTRTGPAARRFERALRDPARAQHAVLQRILAANARAAFGRAHGFEELSGPEAFRRALPARRYEELQPWIVRAAAGEPGVLTEAPVQSFERTSGSTGANKDIPMTGPLLAEFQAALYPWLHDLFRARPRLVGTSAYWAISPLGRSHASTAGGIPVGSGSDAAYFDLPMQLALAGLLAVPPDVAHAGDLDTCRALTALSLLRDPDLGMISVWSPTFLTLLLEHIESRWDALLRDVRDGTLSMEVPPALFRRWTVRPDPDRARALARAIDGSGRLDVRRAWPRLSLVSCWTAGSSARFARALEERLGGVEMQGKGLLATEGVVTVPRLGAPGALPALTSHFLEFVDLDARTTHLAHELVPGPTYEVLITTSGGLYRYRLGDCVRVVGQVQATPCLEFVGRADGRSDLCGEKLSLPRVTEVVERALRDVGCEARFVLLAPEHGSPPRYVLFIEPSAFVGTDDALAARIEALLQEGEHYAYARSLGQLGSVEVVRIVDGVRGYERAAIARGQRAGDLKPMVLHPATDWRQWFERAGPS